MSASASVAQQQQQYQDSLNGLLLHGRRDRLGERLDVNSCSTAVRTLTAKLKILIEAMVAWGSRTWTGARVDGWKCEFGR